MISEDPLIVLFFFSPILAFAFFFRSAWRDKELVAACLLATLTGATVTIPVKMLAYPGINSFLGIELRKMLISSESLPLKALGCIGIIGPVEETAKLLSVLFATWIIGTQTRAAAIFLSSVAAGIGFSLVENLDYFAIYGSQVLPVRVLISSTGHAVFSGISGLAIAFSLPRAHLGGKKQATFGFALIMIGLMISAVSHGIFNTIAFLFSIHTSLIMLGVTLIFGLAILYELWLKALKMDIPSIPILWFCSDCGIQRVGRERFCPQCGRRVTTVQEVLSE